MSVLGFWGSLCTLKRHAYVESYFKLKENDHAGK